MVDWEARGVNIMWLMKNIRGVPYSRITMTADVYLQKRPFSDEQMQYCIFLKC